MRDGTQNITGNHWTRVIWPMLMLAAVVVFLYTVRAVLPPFVIAFFLAWLLGPVPDALQKRHLPRFVAIVLVYLGFLAALGVILAFIAPLVIHQGQELAHDFPSYMERAQAYSQRFMAKHQALLRKLDLPTTPEGVFARYGERAAAALQVAVQRFSSWLVSNLPIVLWLVLIPLSAFYFLYDMEGIRQKWPLFIPRHWRERTTAIGSKIGVVFGSYVRGLVVVCLIYGTAAAIILAAFGLRYGVILGIIAGLLYAVPYFGAITTALTVFLVGLATYEHAIPQAVWAALAVIVLNQVFDMGITPKVLGKSVGLHPLWALFALMCAAELFGIMGMLFAIPAAASIQEIVFEFNPELRPTPKKRRRPSLRFVRKQRTKSK